MSAPVGNTCPIIDDALFAANSAYDEAEHMLDNIYTLSYEDMKERLTTIKKHMGEIESIMEDIREANRKLRAWGDECEDEQTRLENENSDYQDDIRRLEYTNRELEDTVNELNNTISDQDYTIRDLEERLSFERS